MTHPKSHLEQKRRGDESLTTGLKPREDDKANLDSPSLKFEVSHVFLNGRCRLMAVSRAASAGVVYQHTLRSAPRFCDIDVHIHLYGELQFWDGGMKIDRVLTGA